LLLGKPDYLGLGVDAQYPGAVTIVSAFKEGGAHAFSWLWKLVYTAITLGTGFKGGEVTPLFYIGATLGNTLADLLNAPTSLFAALGFIAVFAGATNTPLACTLMGIELFGSEHAVFFAVACFTAYFFSGNAGIYSAQKTATPKFDPDLPEGRRRPGSSFLKNKFSKYKF
jgi:H+/Cl- antiporter ClcA